MEVFGLSQTHSIILVACVGSFILLLILLALFWRIRLNRRRREDHDEAEHRKIIDVELFPANPLHHHVESFSKDSSTFEKRNVKNPIYEVEPEVLGYTVDIEGFTNVGDVSDAHSSVADQSKNPPTPEQTRNVTHPPTSFQLQNTPTSNPQAASTTETPIHTMAETNNLNTPNTPIKAPVGLNSPSPQTPLLAPLTTETTPAVDERQERLNRMRLAREKSKKEEDLLLQEALAILDALQSDIDG